MTDRHRWAVWTAALGMLTLMLMVVDGAGAADGRIRRGVRRLPPPESVAAFAALDPVSAEMGWGRIAVRDELLPSGLHRTIHVWVYQLDSLMPYEIQVEGVTLGTLTTDRQGFGSLELQSEGRGHQGIPAGLPPAADISSAVVLDRSLAAVLSGTFSVVRQQEADRTIYEDKILLDDVTGGDAVGMACVRVRESATQQFVTRASRLEPGGVCDVVVDDHTAGVVTADAEGQACLDLRFPAEDNPLPAELRPAYEIATVQWWCGGRLLLMGSFPGDDDDCAEELRGEVLRVDEDGLLLRVEGRELAVRVTAETRFKEFEELGQLGEGDVVVVEGCFDGEVLVAAWVLLAEDADAEECAEVRGEVLRVDEDGLLLRVEGQELAVRVTAETRFEEFEELGQLGEGDIVVAEGCFDGEVLVAAWVLLAEDADAEECAEVRGEVLRVDEDGLLLRVEGSETTVRVTAETRFKEFEELGQLGEGDIVVAEGCFDGEVLVAAWVLLAEDADAPTWWETEGTLIELGESGFRMDTGEEVLQVVVSDETSLSEFDSLDQLRPGDRVLVEGLCDGETLTAEAVTLLGRAE